MNALCDQSVDSCNGDQGALLPIDSANDELFGTKIVPDDSWTGSMKDGPNVAAHVNYEADDDGQPLCASALLGHSNLAALTPLQAGPIPSTEVAAPIKLPEGNAVGPVLQELDTLSCSPNPQKVLRAASLLTEGRIRAT
ncbi:hypothetical protein SESBI_48676 [Sesbania bispinosa]|nr:hypothetical protein SESBI_48676 [Sesbania bispinosa]